MAKALNKQLSLAVLVAAFFFAVPFFANAQSVNITVSATIGGTSSAPTSTPPAPPTPGTGGGFYVSPYTEVIFSGEAYPLANITIMKNDTVIASFKVNSDGTFSKEIDAFPSGTFIFTIYAEDSQGRTSQSVVMTVPILEDKTTQISQIFIPPTMDLQPSAVTQGHTISFSGEAFPQSQVNILIMPKNLLASSTSDQSGLWNYLLQTNDFATGDYTAQAKSLDSSGNQSGFSKTFTFTILKTVCHGADLNGDGKVDLVDFSILLYFWGQKNPANICADLSKDGIVDITDFSIMMYYWTG